MRNEEQPERKEDIKKIIDDYEEKIKNLKHDHMKALENGKNH